MKFEIIPYQQTPKVDEITDETQLDENIQEYKEMHVCTLVFDNY